MKHLRLLAALLVALPCAAHAAEPLSSTFIEPGYQRTDLDGGGTGDGAAVSASLALGSKLHLFGSYARQSDETTWSDPGFGDIYVDTDVNSYRVGLGFNHAFNERLHLVVRGAYEREHVDMSFSDGFNSFKIDGRADGWSAEAGVRGLLADTLEGWAMAGYADVSTADVMGESVDTDEDEDDQAYGRLGGQWHFTRGWGVVGEARLSSDFNQYFLGMRASF